MPSPLPTERMSRERICEMLRVEAADEDVDAFAREQDGDCATDAGRAAGDDDPLS